MKNVISIALINLFTISSLFADIKINSIIADVEGVTEAAKKIQLYEVNPKGITLVYFYPKADTPGCTAQACSLRDQYVKISKLGVQVIGVSTDSVEDQRAFKIKHRLPFTLVADTEKKWAKAFEVPTTFGFVKRQAFLIKNNKIIWMDREASTNEQAQDIIKFLESSKSH